MAHEPNTLYYGDNLDVLRRHVKDETVDLVCLDPPFKSNQDYNVLLAENSEKALTVRPVLPMEKAAMPGYRSGPLSTSAE